MKLHAIIFLISVFVYTAFGQSPAVSPPPPPSPAAAAAASPESDEQPIKVSTYLVNIPVIASDRDGRHISGLTKDNFTILQDGEKQPIEFFASGDSPMTVAVMIDTSGSTLRIIDEIKSAARNFVKVLGPEDQALIVSFDGRYNFLSELTSRRKDLENCLLIFYLL